MSYGRAFIDCRSRSTACSVGTMFYKSYISLQSCVAVLPYISPCLRNDHEENQKESPRRQRDPRHYPAGSSRGSSWGCSGLVQPLARRRDCQPRWPCPPSAPRAALVALGGLSISVHARWGADRLMTFKGLAFVIMGLTAFAACVAMGFWHQRQLDADPERQGGHETDRWRRDPRPFTVGGERAEQSADADGREESAGRESLKTTD